MTYLITQMVLCLLLAALFGFIIGWALRSMACQKKIAELEAAWADRLAAASAGGAPVEKDDLKRIEGIGPRIEKMLNDDQIRSAASKLSSVRAWKRCYRAIHGRLSSCLRGRRISEDHLQVFVAWKAGRSV